MAIRTYREQRRRAFNCQPNPHLKVQVQTLHPEHLHTAPNVTTQSEDTEDHATLPTFHVIFAPTPLVFLHQVLLHVHVTGTGQTENSKPHHQRPKLVT